MSPCSKCGAIAEEPCTELFERLLVLDYSLQEPWGPMHGVVVACYRLQHSELSDADREGLLDLLNAYAQGGQQALGHWVDGARRANSHRYGRTGPGDAHHPPAQAPMPWCAPRDYEVTIADVAVDGTFPAEGHQERVGHWVRATLAAWQR